MIGAVLILIGWVFYVSSKQIERNQRIQDEISMLQAEADKVRQENETLSERISYFASDDFREQEAKRKLGLKKTEETVVEVKLSRLDQSSLTSGYGEMENGGGDQLASSGNSGDANGANYKKWWKVFFGVN